MAKIDKEATRFVVGYGDNLRRSPFPELAKNVTNKELTTPIDSPEPLKQFKFTLTRVFLKDGRLRVIVEGWRRFLGGLLHYHAMDAFDMFSNGNVQEIPRNDEDHCGRA